MHFIFIKSRKPGNEDSGTLYARVRTKGLNKKYKVICIKKEEWEKIHALQYSPNSILSSSNIKYTQLSELLWQIKLYFEKDFDPSTASFDINKIKNKILSMNSFN